MEQSIIATGTVVSMDPATNTATIILTAGGILYNIGMINSVGGAFSTDINPMPNMVGAVVLLVLIGNTWYIMGTVPQPASPDYKISTSPSDTGTGTDNKDTYGKTEPSSAADLSQGRTTAIQSGDKVLSTDGGSEITLGSEGLVLLKASPLAQFMLGAFKDFAKLVAREIFIYSDFGKIEFTGGGPKGRTGLNIYGGATYCDESSTNEPIWTVRQMYGDVPGDPNARYFLKVNSTDLSKYVTVTNDTAGCNHTKMSHDTYNEVGRDAQYVAGRNFRIAVGYDPESASDKVNDNLFKVYANDEGRLDINDSNTFPTPQPYYDRRPNEYGTCTTYPDGSETREKYYQNSEGRMHIVVASDFLLRVGDELHAYAKSNGILDFGEDLYVHSSKNFTRKTGGTSYTEVFDHNTLQYNNGNSEFTQGDKIDRVSSGYKVEAARLTVEAASINIKASSINISKG